MIIRQEQIEIFRQHHLQRFENEMVEHLKKFSPEHCKVAGETTVRQVIRIGIENAQTYGFTNRGPLRLYIELMFAFGCYFDTDPQYPWAGAVLNDPENVDQKARADRLWNQTRDYFAKVFGPKHEHADDALQRLKRARVEDFARSDQPLEESILRTLFSIYPQKCADLGESTLRRLVRKGFDLAHDYNLTTDTGRTVVVALTIALGHRFVEDPLWGWARKRIADNRLADPEARAQQLYSKAMLYLEHAIAGRTETSS
ncbi:MAG: hypothetical protein ACR2JB_24795 [Bryobacteraceae bacterium]